MGLTPREEGGDPMAKKYVKVVRDAGNGRYVKASKAKTSPKTTVTETVKR